MATIGEIFRKTFEGFKVEPSDRVWQHIEQHLDAPTTSGAPKLNKGKTAIIAASLVVITAVVFTLIQLNSENKTTTIKQENQTKQNQSNNSQKTIQTENTLSPQTNSNGGLNKNSNHTLTVVNPIIKCQPIAAVQNAIQNNTNNQNTSVLQQFNPIQNNTVDPFMNKTETQLTLKTNPVFTISKNDTLCKGESIVIKASGGQTYQWNTGEISDSIVISPLSSTQYTVTVTATGVDTVLNSFVTVKSCYSLFVPTAFTPDNDGKNDYFHPVKQDNIGIEKFEMKIVARNGKIVYSTNSFEDIGWDGKFDGNAAPESFYLWYIKYTDSDFFSHELRGQVYLYRH
ncbi:MAG: T9SS type B sorting domain-containing protein [Bacteroidota bacterium]